MQRVGMLVSAAGLAVAVAVSGCTAVPAEHAASAANTLLATLAVKGRAPLTGYHRSDFGTAWTDDNSDPDGHNGCDTRNDILRRDLVDQRIEPGTHGCVVLSGVLHDPYTGRTIDFTRGVETSLAVQIDHVVALGDADQGHVPPLDHTGRARRHGTGAVALLRCSCGTPEFLAGRPGTSPTTRCRARRSARAGRFARAR